MCVYVRAVLCPGHCTRTYTAVLVYVQLLTYHVHVLAVYNAIPGRSRDVCCYYGVLEYSDIPCTCILPSRDGPGMSVVTMVYWNTLTYRVHVYCHPGMVPGCP